MSRSVLILGSNSFSGGDFVDLLLEQTDYRVIGVSRSPEKGRVFLAYRERADLSRFAFHQLDLNRDMELLFVLLARERPAFVVNFASQSEVAPSWTHPEQWFQTNAVAVAHLGNFLKDQDWLERYVHISTPEVYGNTTGVVTETAPIDPSTPYAASRAAGELMLFTLVKQHGFPLVVTRAANVYGAHQQLHKIIPRALIYLRLGRTIPLHAGGHHVRSFIHIRDVSRAELAAMERGGAGEIYNLATEETITIRDLVRRICARAGADFERCTESIGDRPGQDSAYRLDAAKARTHFGWEPLIGLDEGLAQTADWIEREWEVIRTLPLEYVHRP